MEREQLSQSGIKLEQEKTFERRAISGIFVVAGSIASCHWPIVAVPTLTYCAEFFRQFRKYKNLGKQTSISEK